MNSIIRRLYDITLEEDLLHNSGYDREIREKIKKFIADNKIEISAERRDAEDLAFALAELGEEAGFVQGFKCAVQLFSECLSGMENQ